MSLKYKSVFYFKNGETSFSTLFYYSGLKFKVFLWKLSVNRVWISNSNYTNKFN